MNIKHFIILLQDSSRPTNEGSTTLTSGGVSHASTPIASNDSIINSSLPTSASISPSLSLSFSNPDTTGGGPCNCAAADCQHYVGIPYPNLLGRSIEVDCCCDQLKIPDTTVTITARRRVTYEPCEDNPGCNCDLPIGGNYCGCPGFYEDFTGSGSASGDIVLHGTVTTGSCPPIGGYTLVGSMSCGGFVSISDSNYNPGSFPSDEVTGNYSLSCNQLTISWNWVHDGGGGNITTQQTYINATWNMDNNNQRCCS